MVNNDFKMHTDFKQKTNGKRFQKWTIHKSPNSCKLLNSWRFLYYLQIFNVTLSGLMLVYTYFTKFNLFYTSSKLRTQSMVSSLAFIWFFEPSSIALIGMFYHSLLSLVNMYIYREFLLKHWNIKYKVLTKSLCVKLNLNIQWTISMCKLHY